MDQVPEDILEYLNKKTYHNALEMNGKYHYKPSQMMTKLAQVRSSIRGRNENLLMLNLD